MRWLEIAVRDADEAAWRRFLALLGASAEAEETTPGGASLRKCWLPADGDAAPRARRAAAACGLAEVSIVETAPDDWIEGWKRFHEAQPVGERLWVRPPFGADAPAGRIALTIEPGMAFGTGGHPTTRLCLTAIEALAPELAGASALDFGCGSGVLAIAAKKLGLGEVVAVDCAPEAVAGARRAARMNGVAIACARACVPPARRFALVVANILAEPLIALAPRLAAATGRRLVLSGVLAEQTGRVAAAYARAGLRLVRRTDEGEWAALWLAREG